MSEANSEESSNHHEKLKPRYGKKHKTQNQRQITAAVCPFSVHEPNRKIGLGCWSL